MLISLGFEILGGLVRAGDGMRAFDGGDDALGLAQILETAHGFLIGGPRIVDAADILEPCMFRSHGRVIEARGNRVGIERLAFGVFEQVALCTLEHAQLTGSGSETNGVASGFGTVTASFITV